MREMGSRSPIVGIVVALILSSPAFAAGLSNDENQFKILGKWDSLVHAGKTSLMLEFLQNGKIKEESIIEKAGRYTLKGGRLITFIMDAKDLRENQRVFDVVQSGDKTALKEVGKSLEINLERVCKGNGSQSDILGEWFSGNYPGALPVVAVEKPLRFPTFVEFTKDKELYFRSDSLGTVDGEYELSGRTLQIKLGNKPSVKTKVRISSDLADIRISTQGPEIPFRRVTGSGCLSASSVTQ